MASWREVEQDSPEFAVRVRSRFSMGTNKTMATVRRDGSPRISATELEFQDGEITLGMLGGSMKLLDVRRDPRVAIHCPTVELTEPDADAWPGDAKLAGVLVESAPPAEDPVPGAAYFRIDLTELALMYLGAPADHLVIESWHPATGWRRRTRSG